MFGAPYDPAMVAPVLLLLGEASLAGTIGGFLARVLCFVAIVGVALVLLRRSQRAPAEAAPEEENEA